MDKVFVSTMGGADACPTTHCSEKSFLREGCPPYVDGPGVARIAAQTAHTRAPSTASRMRPPRVPLRLPEIRAGTPHTKLRLLPQLRVRIGHGVATARRGGGGGGNGDSLAEGLALRHHRVQDVGAPGLGEALPGRAPLWRPDVVAPLLHETALGCNPSSHHVRLRITKGWQVTKPKASVAVTVTVAARLANGKDVHAARLAPVAAVRSSRAARPELHVVVVAVGVTVLLLGGRRGQLATLAADLPGALVLALGSGDGGLEVDDGRLALLLGAAAAEEHGGVAPVGGFDEAAREGTAD